MAYCTQADLFRYAVPAGMIPNPGRLASGASTSTSAIALPDHGLVSGAELQLRAEGGGSTPSPLSSARTYYALPVDSGHFQVSATAGGTAIVLATTGSRFLVIEPIPYEAEFDWASRVIDDMLPSHIVPLSAPYPDVVVMTAAELAGWKLMSRAGVTATTVSAVYDAARARLARWAKGATVRSASALPAALAVSATAGFTDSRGWRRYGGL